MARYVFLSFVEEDGFLADAVEQSLNRAGLDVWRFDRYLAPGMYSKDKIEAAIRGSHAFVVLLTSTAAKASWVNQEIGIATVQGKDVVPVVQSGIPAEQLGVLTGKEWITYNPQDIEYTLASLTGYFAQTLKDKKSRNVVFGAVALAVAGVLLFPVFKELWGKLSEAISNPPPKSQLPPVSGAAALPDPKGG